MKIHKLDNEVHTEIYEWDKEDLKRSREDLGIDIFDYATELKANENGVIAAGDIKKIMVYDGRAYSLEADHGNYSDIPDGHPLHQITDPDPYIIIPEIIKKSKDIFSFNNGKELTRFVHQRVCSLLIGPQKKYTEKYPL